MLLSVLTRKGQVPKHCCLPPRSRPRPRGEVLGQEGYPAGVQEGIHPAPSLLPPASAWPWLRGQVSAGSSCRARSQTPPNQLNCCYYKGECWFQSKKYLDLDQVHQSRRRPPPGRGREEADRVGFDLINARIPPPRRGSAPVGMY